MCITGVSGVIGKSFYSKGGGVNYMCLPNDPDFPDNKQLGFQTQAFMYGVEFKSPATSDFFKDVHNEDAPCAVCDVEGRTRSLMIPAKRSCPTGWTQEYEGFLASQKGAQKGSEFICVANDPHPSNNSNRDSDRECKLMKRLDQTKSNGSNHPNYLSHSK